MNKQEAMQHGLGYAAGREDASGIKTVLPATHKDIGVGFLAFAEEYAQAWDDFNLGKRNYLPSAYSAYDTWQASDGETIIPSNLAAFDPYLRNDYRAPGLEAPGH